MDQRKEQKSKDAKKSTKPLKIWENDEAFHKTLAALKREINKNPLIQQALGDIIPNDNKAHSISNDFLQKMLRDKKLKKREHFKLFNLLFDFRNDYDAEILIKKKENNFSIWPVLAKPSLFIFKMKGMNLPSSRKRPISPLSGKKGESVNIAEINDGTDPGDYWGKTQSQFFQVFTELESKIIPAVVKYTNRRGRKLFLLYIPSHLNMTKFNTAYWKIISKIHGEFYEKTYRGRPGSKLAMGKKIYWVMRDHWGSPLSIDRLCEIAGDRLGKEAVTIKRHYKYVIKRVKEAKIT